VPLPWPCTNDEYERIMAAAVAGFESDGFTHVAFGDLFLDDVRQYRVDRLAGTGLSPLFPLWKTTDTRALAETMIAAGLRARVATVDPRVLDAAFAGREFDRSLLADLPEGVDPCGERGEFHTCVWDGPMFSRPVRLSAGEVVSRDSFVFADLRPAPAADTAPTP
jgi:diphthamide synthase (EF-2-diphthine--ammonia ligase)